MVQQLCPSSLAVQDIEWDGMLGCCNKPTQSLGIARAHGVSQEASTSGLLRGRTRTRRMQFFVAVEQALVPVQGFQL